MCSLETRFWIGTAANCTNAILLLVVIWGIMLALAVIAPVISPWPLFVVLPTGFALSIAALRSGKQVQSRASRLTGYVLNGSALALYVSTVVVIGWQVVSSVGERFIITDGFQGTVYIIRGAHNGVPEEKDFWGYTYRIPDNGILATQTPVITGWTRFRYYYQLPNGRLQRLNFWPTTITNTAENRANTTDYGVYFPRGGGFGDSSPCRWDEFYVGTKAGILANPKGTTAGSVDIDRYIQEHGFACGSTR